MFAIVARNHGSSNLAATIAIVVVMQEPSAKSAQSNLEKQPEASTKLSRKIQVGSVEQKEKTESRKQSEQSGPRSIPRTAKAQRTARQKNEAINRAVRSTPKRIVHTGIDNRPGATGADSCAEHAKP